MRIYLLIFLFSFSFADEWIEVEKHGVLHRFVSHNDWINRFVRNDFPIWEKETFLVFEEVKDPKGIAIDLGAWIGTTSIWLSNHFYHVLAVEADLESVECLKKNLQASECTNITICNHPISDLSQDVLFGPRGNYLNESISCIKIKSDNFSDYLTHSITLKQLIYDYIYNDPALHTYKISFIKCDIEGGEENILEDLLHFAYYNQSKTYISFHLDWWKQKKIKDFEYLFKYFETNCPISDLCQYIEKNPFCSILFKPIENKGLLVKKNLPALIIGYNQLTYIRNMVQQLEKYTSDISIIDNASDYQPLLDYYSEEFKYTLLKQNKNKGHLVYDEKPIQNLVGDVYLLTDPDLKFNPRLPNDFIQQLIDVSHYFHSYKTGFALTIDADNLRTDIDFIENEKWAWRKKVSYEPNPNLEIYETGIDTTFCLINRLYHGTKDIRVAGDFICRHIPWHKNYREGFEPGEFESYLRNNISSHFFDEGKK